MIRKERKTWWALLLVAALLISLLPTAVLAENGSAGSGVDYTVSPDADTPEQEPVEEEPEEPEEEEPVEEPEEELIEDVALQMIAPLSMSRAATQVTPLEPKNSISAKDGEVSFSGTDSPSEVFPLMLEGGATVRLQNLTVDYSADGLNYPGCSPISVAEGATATIIIEGNVTLKGGNASGTTGAAPAIHVPEGSTLYIESTGEREANGTPKDSLTVYGGNAAKGGDGTTAAWGSCGTGYTWYGGQGGEGGGGAAPAIGGKGGTGGAAPERQAPMYNGKAVTYLRDSSQDVLYVLFDGSLSSDINYNGSTLENPSRWSFSPVPQSVKTGNKGNAGTGAGSVYITGSLTLFGSGGAEANGGKGADGGDGVAREHESGAAGVGNGPNFAKNTIFKAGSDDSTALSDGIGWRSFFSGGGGGGGGGGGCAAPFIGSGGAGGSSGGSGAPPVLNFFVGLADSTVSTQTRKVESSSAPGGAGGGGGWPNGGGGGGGGAAEWTDEADTGYVYGFGSGGGSGQAGVAGESALEYTTIFGAASYYGGNGGSSGAFSSESAAGGAKIESEYKSAFFITDGFTKTYTFPAGGRGGVAVSCQKYPDGSSIVLSTGVKKGTLSSGSGYADTLFGGGYGHGASLPTFYKKDPVGIYDLADCTLTVLSRETATDTAGATVQPYTGHNYAPELYKTDLIEGSKHKGLQITVSYTHADNTLVPEDCLEPIEKETSEEITTESGHSYSYLTNLGIDESSAAVSGHSTLINVGDTYQISGMSSSDAVRRVLGIGVLSKKAAAVGTWTDTLQITPVSPTDVTVTAKEGNTLLTTGNFLSSNIKASRKPSITLDYGWSDGTNSHDDLWLLVSKAGTMSSEDGQTGSANDPILYEVWSVSKDGGSSEEISRHRYTKSDNTVRKQTWGKLPLIGETKYGWSEVQSESAGEIGTGTTTDEFPEVSTSSASYTFTEPGEYTFTLTLSGMGYETKTATFTVRVKQQIEVSIAFDGAGELKNRGTTSEQAWNVHPNQTMTITANGLPDGATATLTLVYPYHNTTADNAGVFKRVVGEASAGSPFSYTPTNDIVEGQTGGTTVQVYVSDVTSDNEYYVWNASDAIAVPAVGTNHTPKDGDFPTIYVTMHNYADNDGFCTVEMVNGTTTTTCGEYQPAETGNGGHYQITNAGQLYWFAAMVNGDTTHVHDYEQKKSAFSPFAYLENNIDLASEHNPNKVTDGEGNIVGYEWIPINYNATVDSNYTTTAKRIIFNGNGKTISGLYISEAHGGFNGFIAVASGNAQISNFTLEGTIDAPTNGGSGDTGIGSVVGWGANFKLEDVTSKVNISGSGLYHVGGLVGCTRGEDSAKSFIIRCIYEGTITLTQSTDSIGGIAGCAHWVDILYSANRGSISTTAGGGSTHPDLVGGIAGQLENGSIKNCYNSVIPKLGTENKGSLIGTLRTSTTVENSVYPDSTSAIVNDESGTGNTAQEHPTLTAVSDFSTGEACYLANGETSTPPTGGGQFWYQNIDNAASNNGQNPDAYPRLAREFAASEPANGAIVYQMPDKETYSNSLPVYSVDVSWGSMLFTYQQGEWQPDKHDYAGNWQDATADVNQVTVANNSDWKVNASVQFEAVDAFADKVAGTITFGNENWSGQVLDAQKSGTATLQLSRKPNTTSLLENDFTGGTSTKVGTVTVTITPGSYNN